MLLDAVPGFHSTLYTLVTRLLFWHGHSPVGRVPQVPVGPSPTDNWTLHGAPSFVRVIAHYSVI